MAYSTIDKSTAHFNNILHSGNGGTQSITGVGFRPDLTWIKDRTGGNDHQLVDAVRGATVAVSSNRTDELTFTDGLTSFDSDGYSLGSNTRYNGSGSNYVGWNWLAGGTAPAITYVVKVVSDSGNKYRFDDFGTSAVTLDLQEGGTYTFDQADSSNSGHPLRFYTASDKSGGEYTTGVTTTGTPGSSGAKTVITVASGAPTLYYQCSSHAGMGGQANTNSLFGSSNFKGTIQSKVSANDTAGFSIIRYTGNGSGSQTIGHGLSSTPSVTFRRNLDNTLDWFAHTNAYDGTFDYFKLNATSAKSDSGLTAFTATTAGVDGNTDDYIVYCFAEKTGYSKFGSYVGNNNQDGPFIYTGFKPAFVLFKRGSDTENWSLYDNKRANAYNPTAYGLRPNISNNESAYGAGGSAGGIDILSNGFKIREGGTNINDGTYLYMAFGQTIVGSNNIPATAR